MPKPNVPALQITRKKSVLIKFIDDDIEYKSSPEITDIHTHTADQSDTEIDSYDISPPNGHDIYSPTSPYSPLYSRLVSHSSAFQTTNIGDDAMIPSVFFTGKLWNHP